MSLPSWLALDVGGANLKAAHASGPVVTRPFALWKAPSALPDELAALASAFPPTDRVALTMTAELCDCFATKAEGVRAILDSVRTAFPRREVMVWGTDGRFHTQDEVDRNPMLAAAANWLALATVAARMVPEGPGLIIDIGTTTTDLIPCRDGRPVPRGRTDTDRLRSGELVYAGVRRTPVCALATDLWWQGTRMGLMAEWFATTRDIYLLLGDLPEDPEDRDTADGRPATSSSARDRMARMVGADRDRVSVDDMVNLARAADTALYQRLIASAERACGEGSPSVVVVAGSGAFLARRVAERIVAPGGKIVDLERAWGVAASTAACARALLLLAEGRGGRS